LEGFKRIHLNPGESQEVEFVLTPRQLSLIGKDEVRVLENGWFTVSVGGGQPNVKKSNAISGRFNLTGKNRQIE
jgi:beta-glucosidase